MNQQQREYLIKQVRSEAEKKIRPLKASIPSKPSLNNYLVAAFLDDTIKFADLNELKRKIPPFLNVPDCFGNSIPDD